jgi:hypothetical protein
MIPVHSLELSCVPLGILKFKKNLILKMYFLPCTSIRSVAAEKSQSRGYIFLYRINIEAFDDTANDDEHCTHAGNDNFYYRSSQITLRECEISATTLQMLVHGATHF